jgi:hypothetical protein
MLSNPFSEKEDKVKASEVLSFLAKTYQNTLKDYDAKVSHINNQYQIIDTKMNTIIRLLEEKEK